MTDIERKNLSKNLKRDSDGFIYGFRLEPFESSGYVEYERPNTILYDIPEIVEKGERFADFPNTNKEYLLSTQGHVVKRNINNGNGRIEYIRIDTYPSSFVIGDDAKPTNVYMYVDIESSKLCKRGVKLSPIMADLFLDKPKYIVFEGGLFTSKIPISQKKLHVGYKDGNGTNLDVSNIKYEFHNDTMYRGYHEGKITLTDESTMVIVFTSNENGDCLTVKRVIDGSRKTGASIGKESSHGKSITEMCKGRKKCDKDADGEYITARYFDMVDEDTKKIVIDMIEDSEEPVTDTLF